MLFGRGPFLIMARRRWWLVHRGGSLTCTQLLLLLSVFLLHLLRLLLVLLLQLLISRSIGLLLCRSLVFLLLLLRQLLVLLLLLRIQLLLLLPVLLILVGISGVGRRGQRMLRKILRMYRSGVRCGVSRTGSRWCPFRLSYGSIGCRRFRSRGIGRSRFSCRAICGWMVRCPRRFCRHDSAAAEFSRFGSSSHGRPSFIGGSPQFRI